MDVTNRTPWLLPTSCEAATPNTTVGELYNQRLQNQSLEDIVIKLGITRQVGSSGEPPRSNCRGGGVGKLQHQCPYCKYSTVRKDHFTKHVRTHTGEKPFTCSFCCYRAASKDNLKLHIRTHTGEKPFSCPYCHFRAARKDSLQVHIRIHTGEKPYACPKCPYRSSQRNALISHMLKHRSIEQNGQGIA
ncbi:hypothetical protein SK128_019468 [Halocaridina rubra]|uniref:C2H2-type domain-containing protein n=1 Tax=Halocaridina rubra TaxID=373956 RepID=A0AAN8WU71_HALRR